jgi:hypothetical protein
MAKKDEKGQGMMAKVGPWAFILGLVLAAVMGLVLKPITIGMLVFLGVLGLVVGLLNVTDKETNTYLIASIAFLISASSFKVVLEPIPFIGEAAAPFLTNVVFFIAPGVAVVALKALYNLSKD